MKRLEETLTTRLKAQGVPPARASGKARNTVRGIYLMVLGAGLLGAGVIVVLLREPNVYVVGFGVVLVLGGFYLGLLGSQAFSGELTDNEAAAEEALTTRTTRLITAVGRAIGFARGKMPKNDTA